MPKTTEQHHIPQSHSADITLINNGKISNDGYIVGKAFDRIWFTGAPLLGLIVALFFLPSGIAGIEVNMGSAGEYRVFDLVMGTFLTSHLFLVFFRSHGNPDIFALHPVRFIAVPILLMIYLTYSAKGLVIIAIIAILWDVHHSAQQTFGLGRIYDMRVGNHQQAGRRLDSMLNLLIWVGPILAGASLMGHVYTYSEIFHPTGIFSDNLPSYIFNHKSDVTRLVFLIGIPFLIYYIYAYWQLYKQGYVFSVNKVILLVSTAVISMFCWGFNSFGEAYFVMNFYHSWQYFAIVWAFEKKNITNLFFLSGIKHGRYLSLFLFVFIALSYGLWATISESSNSNLIHSILFTVSIMHFWYDGFIWSVKKKQV